MDIHVFWEGPFDLKQVERINNEDRDYGVYQIYGHHPLYGSSVLLYIGQAQVQTFGKRISQQEWKNRSDPDNMQVYVGRLAGRNKITSDAWNTLIEQTEKLLIYAHQPAFNTQSTKSLPEEDVLENRIYNWYSHRDLFPEVSGRRFTSRFDHIVEDHIYEGKRVLD